MALPASYTIGVNFIESQMLDTCVITRDKGLVHNDVLDEETGVITPAAPGELEIYLGKCLFRRRTAIEQEKGGSSEDSKTYIVLIPKSATDVRQEDRLEITASTDPMLLDQRFRILRAYPGTHSTYRRLEVEDIPFGT